MAQIKISALGTGTPKGTDLTPAVDTTDTTQGPAGSTKKYVRSDEFNYYMGAMSYATKSACRVATPSALTVTYANGALGVGATLTNAGAQAPLSIDGVSLAVNDRVLVWNQASALENGIYTVTTVGTIATNWVMTRATDYDQAADVAYGQVVLVNQGGTYTGQAFQQIAPGAFTMGTTSIVFEEFNPARATGGIVGATISGTTQAAALNTRYIVANAAQTTITLPAAFTVNDVIIIKGLGAAGWILQAGTGDTIVCGTQTTSLGGTLTSAAGSDTVQVSGLVNNTTWGVDYTFSAGLTVA